AATRPDTRGGRARSAAASCPRRPRLAVCTRQHRGRGPESYLDLSYWADMDRSVYRPQWTLDELLREPGFTYVNRRFVERFEETADGVRVRVVHADTGAAEVHEGRALVLAARTPGTAWLVLRSLGLPATRAPLHCTPYSYVPTLNTGMLFREARDRRCSLAQLTAIVRIPDTARIVQAQIFSYR